MFKLSEWTVHSSFRRLPHDRVTQLGPIERVSASPICAARYQQIDLKAALHSSAFQSVGWGPSLGPKINSGWEHYQKTEGERELNRKISEWISSSKSKYTLWNFYFFLSLYICMHWVARLNIFLTVGSSQKGWRARLCPAKNTSMFSVV